MPFASPRRLAPLCPARAHRGFAAALTLLLLLLPACKPKPEPERANQAHQDAAFAACRASFAGKWSAAGLTAEFDGVALLTLSYPGSFKVIVVSVLQCEGTRLRALAEGHSAELERLDEETLELRVGDHAAVRFSQVPAFDDER